MPKTRTARGNDGTLYVLFWCPGCEAYHGPSVEGDPSAHPIWAWNGDRVRPTFSPSILVSGIRKLTDEEYQRVLKGEKVEPVDTLCHSFVRDGRIEFLLDCTHALAGQTVDIPDDPDGDAKED